MTDEEQRDFPEGEGDWLTIPEAAQRLGVSVPRLRRALAKPEWETRTETRTRSTRTGTRTAVCVPVPVLDLLTAELAQSPQQTPPGKQEREQVQERFQTGSETRTGTRTKQNGNENGNASLETRLAVAEALVEERGRELERLNTALEKSQALQLAALGEAAAMRSRAEALEQQNRALLEGKRREVEVPENRDSDAQGVFASGPTPQGGSVATPEAPAGGIVARLKRLFGGGA